MKITWGYTYKFIIPSFSPNFIKIKGILNKGYGE